MNYAELDIVCAISILSKFTSNLGHKHWKEISSIMKYLKHTSY